MFDFEESLFVSKEKCKKLICLVDFIITLIYPEAQSSVLLEPVYPSELCILCSPATNIVYTPLHNQGSERQDAG